LIIYIVTSIIFCKSVKRNSWCMFTIVEWSSNKINISLIEWFGRKGLGIVSEICSLASLCIKRNVHQMDQLWLMCFSWPLTLVVYLVEFIVIIKLDWHIVCHQRRHTLIMSWNCLEGLKHALSFYSGEKRPKS